MSSELNGLTIAGHEATENMYSSIDLCIAKIERQVRKYKGKLEEQKVRPHHVDVLPWSHSIVSEGFEQPQGGHSGPQPSPSDEGAPLEFQVVRTEKFHAQPMSVSDAIVQLNLLHETFLVFRSQADGSVAVVYRRDDGSYGLIETAKPQQAA
ncbi:MAG: HPF/RaiA family ribosome-associated protein [Rhodospirillaceae bacterium]|nr:HPF/RaiA family ribosome-associated protein [Rhodospirillaceae bacterium]